MIICAWLAGDQLDTDDAKQNVYDVCEGFFCPSLGTAADYQTWIEQSGLEFHNFPRYLLQLLFRFRRSIYLQTLSLRSSMHWIPFLL